MASKRTIIIGVAVAAIACAAFFFRPRSDKTSAAVATSGPRLLWQYEAERGALATLVLGSDGTVYVGGNNALMALSSDGKLKWQSTYAGLLYIVGASDGNIYGASSLGLIFGFSDDGKLSWNPGAGLIGFGAPPAVGTGGALVYANSVSDVFAFNPQKSNSETWSQNTFREGMLGQNYALPGQATTSQERSRSSPVIWRDETIALGRQHWLHLFNPDGSPQWFIELTTGQLGQAALAHDGTIYIADDRSNLFAVSRYGQLKWTYQPDYWIIGSPIVGEDGTIYLVTSEKTYAVSPDGSLKWSAKMPQPPSTGPALAADGTIYVGGDSGIFALHSDGTAKWALHAMRATGAPTIASDGTIYFPCGYSWVCAVADEGSPLAKSPWPKEFHDPANSNRILTEF